jgi:molybdate transport system substrate-binding protein
VQLDVNLQGLKHYLQTKPDKKIAIANPQHAPYGIAAKQFMIEQGVWPLVEPYLVQAENAGQLTQFTLTGNVALGFIPFSHAIQPAIKAKGRFLKLSVILPQQGVLTIRSTDAAADFVRFLSDDRARQIFTDHGFKVPE